MFWVAVIVLEDVAEGEPTTTSENPLKYEEQHGTIHTFFWLPLVFNKIKVNNR